MKVTRKVALDTGEVRVGDQITITLKGFGRFTATAQNVTDVGILFLFDEAIAKHSMNDSATNINGFEGSDMNRWLHDTVLPAFPENLRRQVKDITLPTYGEIFGHDYFYSIFEPDKDKQFKSMKQRRNRICDFEGDWCWWWLQNKTELNISSANFALVNANGGANCTGASVSGGVRPEFWLVKGENECD